MNLILGISLQKAFSPYFRLDRPLRVALAVEEGPLATPLGRILAEEVPGDLWAVENAASADAARALRPGGELWTVFNSHLPYLPALRRTVGSTTVLGQNPKYVVARSVRSPRQV